VIVTFPPERVMSALAPIAEAAPPLQPQAEMSSAIEDGTSRARRALYANGGA
jgi:two-component system cell cycle sensor histidine kinase PleC